LVTPTTGSPDLSDSGASHHNGDWATFEHCRVIAGGDLSNCDTFRYQISTEELVKIPNPGQQQYGGGVSDDGTVHIVQGGGSNVWSCGHHARIIRYPVGGPGVVITTMAEGKDAFSTFATDETSGSTTLYFTYIVCRTGDQGIYSIAGADTATQAASTATPTAAATSTRVGDFATS
jgi:hypothetical protein